MIKMHIKKITTLLLISILFIGCSFNKKEIITIKVLDQFESKQENIKLGLSLMSYYYPFFLEKEISSLTKEDMKGIKWRYFIQKSNNQISFDLILEGKSISKKDLLVNFFEKKVEEQIKHQINDKEIFNRAIKLADKIANQLNKKELDKVWNDASLSLKKNMTKEQFIKSIERRYSVNAILNEKRIVHSKIYYEKLPGAEENITGFYTINSTFKLSPNVSEQFNFHLEGDALKLVGYFIYKPN